MSEAHQHRYEREGGEGPFICACGKRSEAPAWMVAGARTPRPSSPELDSHVHVGLKRGLYLLEEVVPYFGRDEFTGIYHRNTNVAAVAQINTLLAERHPDPNMPGIHEDGAELRWLARNYGVHLKLEGMGGVPRMALHGPRDAGTRDKDWEHWYDRRLREAEREVDTE